MLRVVLMLMLALHPAAATPQELGQRIVAAMGEPMNVEAVNLLQAELRGSGPAGLAAVGEAFARAQPDGADLPRWDALFDAVAAQRYARYSRLYWYTDLAQAEAAAAEAGRPIVSLRLLGRLGDELSCANSRFFRVALYADPAVADWLRGHVILHWSSERPVPVVTIDFGDGRGLRTTITGNSAHFVLDAQGRPLDCIPGLLGPHAFLAALQRAEELHRRLAGLASGPRAEALGGWHRQRIAAITAQRRAAGLPDAAEAAPALPTAREAGARALSKRLVEQPLLLAAGLGGTGTGDDGRDWAAIATAAGFVADPLSLPSRLLGQAQLEAARDEAFDPARHVDPALVRAGRAMDAFEAALPADTARNELDLHLRIHGLLAERPDRTWEDLDRWLYAGIFLTPIDDAWLGLVPQAYSALPGNGKVPTIPIR